MKLYLILPVLATSALAANDYLFGRAIDPKTLNPTLLSCLSILKTAMPSGTNIPMPSGTYEPDWYRSLPSDVKSLLSQLYPVTTTASTSVSTSCEPTSTTTKTHTTKLTVTKTLWHHSSGTGTGTGTGTGKVKGTGVSNSTLAAPTGRWNATRTSTPSPLPSDYFSKGAKSASGAGTMAAVLISVGAAFFVFA